MYVQYSLAVLKAVANVSYPNLCQNGILRIRVVLHNTPSSRCKDVASTRRLVHGRMATPYRMHAALTNAMPHALCLHRSLQCIVFNCSEQIDHKMPARLFSGLVQTGAWTCLDEFNRINIEVLSVIAEQVIRLLSDCMARTCLVGVLIYILVLINLRN